MMSPLFTSFSLLSSKKYCHLRNKQPCARSSQQQRRTVLAHDDGLGVFRIAQRRIFAQVRGVDRQAVAVKRGKIFARGGDAKDLFADIGFADLFPVG